MASPPLPPPYTEVGTPLPTSVGPLLQALYVAFPDAPCEVVENTEFAVVIQIGKICLTCMRHCADPSHACILVCINTTIVHFIQNETTPAYIQRVVKMIAFKMIEWQMNWLQLRNLFERISYFGSLEIAKEEEKGFFIKAVFSGLRETGLVETGLVETGLVETDHGATATIKRGRLEHCDISLDHEQPNLALMSQFLMMIPPEPEETFYVRIFATENGFIGLHNYQSQRRVISLSNNQGVATKFIVKDISLFDLEKFLTEPTAEIVVIHTTGTPFSGVVGRLEFSCANSATIKVGEERYSVSTGQWAFLQNILAML
jgi:hypothetical protein